MPVYPLQLFLCSGLCAHCWNSSSRHFTSRKSRIAALSLHSHSFADMYRCGASATERSQVVYRSRLTMNYYNVIWLYIQLQWMEVMFLVLHVLSWIFSHVIFPSKPERLGRGIKIPYNDKWHCCMLYTPLGLILHIFWSFFPENGLKCLLLSCGKIILASSSFYF